MRCKMRCNLFCLFFDLIEPTMYFVVNSFMHQLARYIKFLRWAVQLHKHSLTRYTLLLQISGSSNITSCLLRCAFTICCSLACKMITTHTKTHKQLISVQCNQITLYEHISYILYNALFDFIKERREETTKYAFLNLAFVTLMYLFSL